MDLTIYSPVSGFITERNALPNLYTEPSTRLYTVADLSRVWVNAQIFQDEIGRLKLVIRSLSRWTRIRPDIHRED
jgi:multidrug resistance efflux pump